MDILASLGEFAAGSARNLARNLFSGFYERGISANQALQELRAAGIGYRRQDFLRDFREGRGDFDQATSIRYVSPQNVPTDGILKSKYFGTPDKYSLVFKYQATDLDTGDQVTGYFTYHRNSLDTRANMENDAYDYLSEDAESYPYKIEYPMVVMGYINPVWEGNV